MAIKLGPAIFEDHISLELFPHKWTDTFIFPVRHDQALPPWNYAEVVKTVIRALRRSRRSPSLWVPVMAPGKWYFEEVKFALRNASIPVAVTNGRTVPQILDFSNFPGMYGAPCSGGEPTEVPLISDLKKHALRTLLAMARFTTAYNNEIACNLMISEDTSRTALKTLAELGYVEYHPNDGNIDAHLPSYTGGSTDRRRKSKKWNGEYWPYWKIRRPGISAALRAWGVPAGIEFNYRRERTHLLNSRHRRRSRQWPKWISMGLPYAEIYAGWSEVSIFGLGTRPDALAWGSINGAETLFWLEVETSNFSRTRLIEKTSIRWEKAKRYADIAGVHLIFVLLGMQWVRHAARAAFLDVPKNCAAITADWNRLNFGNLPYPKWGEAVIE
jgi:hypothetical protein